MTDICFSIQRLGSPRSRCQKGKSILRLFSWLVGGPHLTLYLQGKTESKGVSLSRVSSFKCSNPIMRALICPMTPSNSNYIPKALSPNTITVGLRASTWELQEGYNHSVHDTVSEDWPLTMT